jgi:hypothetical protein
MIGKPRIELVAPEENVRMGSLAASVAFVSVPSFWHRAKNQNISKRAKLIQTWVRYKGHSSPSRFMAFSKPRMVRFANAPIDALRMDAFSRSMNPTCATMVRKKLELVFCVLKVNWQTITGTHDVDIRPKFSKKDIPGQVFILSTDI